MTGSVFVCGAALPFRKRLYSPKWKDKPSSDEQSKANLRLEKTALSRLLEPPNIIPWCHLVFQGLSRQPYLNSTRVHI